MVVEYVRGNLEAEQFQALTRLVLTAGISLLVGGFIFLTLSGATNYSGRSMTLLDPSYAKKYVPIIASVSEHQPTNWATYYFDFGILLLFMPLGYYFCLVQKCTLGKLFIAMYGVLASYFSCVMIRLMLVLSPAACMLAAIAISELLRMACKSVRSWLTEGYESSPAAFFDTEKVQEDANPDANPNEGNDQQE